MKSNNKLFCFVLLFFPKFVKENDQIISEEKKYLKEEEISNFYNMLDKEILKKKSEDKKEECNDGLGNKKIEDGKEDCNGLENKKNKNEIIIEGKEKNEIGDDFSNHLIKIQMIHQLMKKKSGSDLESNNSSSSKNKGNNQYNNNDVLCMIQELTKEFEKLKESSKKEIDD